MGYEKMTYSIAIIILLSLTHGGIDDLYADMRDVTQKTSRSLYTRMTSSSHSSQDATTLDNYSQSDENPEIEQANFTPSKHNKGRLKTKERGEKKEQPHHIHKEDEDLEKISLRKKPQSVRHPNTKAIDILHTTFSHELQAEDIFQETPLTLIGPENGSMPSQHTGFFSDH